MKALIISLCVVAAAALGALVIFILFHEKKGETDEKPQRKTVREKQMQNAVKPKKVPVDKPAEKIEEHAEKEAGPVAPPVKAVKESAKEVVPEVVTTVVDDTDEDEVGERRLVKEDGEAKYIVIKYSKSFQAKIIQSDAVTKSYYSELKNKLLSYGVKSRMSWKCETFRSGRKTLAKLRLRGKTLSVAFALNPVAFENTKYHVEDISEVKALAETPCLYRIKNDRRVRYAKELIDCVMEQNGVTAVPNGTETDYAAMYPYETTEALINKKLIKELTDEEAQSGTVFKSSDIRQSVSATEADVLMQDEVAEILIESLGGISDRTKTGIVNIDTLSQHFKDGEKVTLEEVKKRVKGFGKNVTYLKVLARGTLDKKLTVEADGFSLQAAKMIILTGGKAVKK